jgi:hypothetical protein
VQPFANLDKRLVRKAITHKFDKKIQRAKELEKKQEEEKKS